MGLMGIVGSSTSAQTGPALVLRPFPNDTRLQLSGDASVFGDAEADDTGEDVGLTIYESAGRARLARPGEIEFRAGYDLLHIDLSTSDPRLPPRLTDQSIAVGAIFQPVDGWTPSLTLGGGYAGDTPYGDSSAWYAKSMLALSRRVGDNDRLVVTLDYDGNRPIFPDIPLPGVDYRFDVPRYDLDIAVGLPFNGVVWRPTDRLTIEAWALLWFQFEAKVNWKLADQWELFARLDSRQQAFNLDELDNHDRLLFKQRRVEAGVTWSPAQSVSFTLAGGYAFGQEFGIGFDTRNDDELLSLDDAPYVRGAFELRF